MNGQNTMMETVVLDTNVALVAANTFNDMTMCDDTGLKIWCVNKLSLIINGKMRIALDLDHEILKDYQRTLSETQLGASFIKWLWQNLWTGPYVDIGEVHKNGTSYDEFPNDPKLADFDLSDRKFVAVSVAHKGKPPVLEATDGKWWKWAIALKRYGIRVEFGDSGFVKRLCQNKHGCQGACEKCYD